MVLKFVAAPSNPQISSAASTGGTFNNELSSALVYPSLDCGSGSLKGQLTPKTFSSNRLSRNDPQKWTATGTRGS